MELDEFKILLKQQKQQPFAGEPMPRVEVLKQLRTGSIISRLKRNLRVELFVAFIFLLFICYEAFTSETLFVRLFTGLMFVFCVWFMIYIASLYRRLTVDHVSTAPVKESLRKLIRVMVQFTRVYFVLTLVMIPVMVLLAFFSAYLGQDGTTVSSFTRFPTRSFLTFTALCLGWFVVMYYVTRLYLQKLYGGYLLSLRQMLHELEQEA